MKNLNIVLLLSVAVLVIVLSGCEDARKACNYDGIVQPPELCDDKNQNPNDRCDSCVPTSCGDDIVNDDPLNMNNFVEQCDNKDQQVADKQCADRGFFAPCNRNTCLCGGISPKVVECNQNLVIEGNEECDKGPNGDSTCTPECTVTYCGDGIVQVPNGKNMNNNPPGFNEICDAGPDPLNLSDPQARAAHAFCQAVLADPEAMCNGCRCVAPPFSCAWGAFAVALGGGPLPPLPPTAACIDDCAVLGPTWACDQITCACTDTNACAGNTLATIFGGANPYTGGACADDCKIFGPDVVCDAVTCLCKPEDETDSCAANTMAHLFVLPGQQPRQRDPNAICKDDCADLDRAFGGDGSSIYCDLASCVCKEKNTDKVSCAQNTFGGFEGDELLAKARQQPDLCQDDCKDQFGPNAICNVKACECVIPDYVSCAANEKLALETGRTIPPIPGRQCRNDCPEGETCSEDCVCQEYRVVTPRCGDGYISSVFVGGGGNEECDIGGGYSNILYPPRPDTCEKPKVCVNCKCVAPMIATGDGVVTGGDGQMACPQGTFANDPRCGGRCAPNQVCTILGLTGPETEATSRACFACNTVCPPGQFVSDRVCEAYYPRCSLTRYKCYAPVGLEDGGDGYVTGGDGYDGGDNGGYVTGGDQEQVTGGDGQAPQHLDCERECSQRGRSTSPTDFSSYILNYLNEYSCVSGATISMQGTLTLTGPAGDQCSCYSTQSPSISINQERPICKGTVCGDVPCGESTSCQQGETKYTVSCNWGGWRQVGENRFTPVIGAAG